jgi:aryl-alcohol dehydrogenase-like predicted oxidoreductase
MRKVKLGMTDAEVSCISLGTMYFGSQMDEATSFTILDHYVSQGGSFIDSANKYASWIPGFQGGESETLIGKWMKLKGNRQNLFITSKVGFPYGDIPRSLKKEVIISECEKSLKRLDIETIDLYFAHAFDSETPIEESMEAFYQLRKAGKILYVGASNYYGWQLSGANMVAQNQGWEGFCCLQQRHTLLDSGLRAHFGSQLVLTPEIQEFCKEKNITLMAYSPLLSGAYVRSDVPIPVQYQSSINDKRLEVLKGIASDLNTSVNAIVLAWMMQSSPLVIPVVGGSSVAQMEENLSSLSLILTGEQMNHLNTPITYSKR